VPIAACGGVQMQYEISLLITSAVETFGGDDLTLSALARCVLPEARKRLPGIPNAALHRFLCRAVVQWLKDRQPNLVELDALLKRRRSN
jgi:hypothetical protein